MASYPRAAQFGLERRPIPVSHLTLHHHNEPIEPSALTTGPALAHIPLEIARPCRHEDTSQVLRPSAFLHPALKPKGLKKMATSQSKACPHRSTTVARCQKKVVTEERELHFGLAWPNFCCGMRLVCET